MIWAGIDTTAFGVLYQVLACHGKIQHMGSVVGGVPVSDGRFIVQAEWDLIPTVAP
jgi:hypothetical protein